MAIRFFDMFAGIGGFRSGLEAVGGFECIGHCEIDKKANQAYNAIYQPKGEIYFEDATKIDTNDLPDIDLICAAFHAKASAWLAKGSDSGTIQEELSSSRLPESLKRNGLHFFSWKTFPDCYRMTEAGRCLPSSPRLLNWGMISNGVCITARFSESPSSGAACILSDILETNVPESYFLSTAAMRKISSNSSPDRKVSVSTIQAEVPALNAPAPVDGADKTRTVFHRYESRSCHYRSCKMHHRKTGFRHQQPPR